jgi:hypothetical protein
MTFSTYSSDLALRFLLGNDDTGRPSSWTLALCSAPPTPTSFVEVAAAGYSRLPISFSSPITGDLATPDDAVFRFGPFLSSTNVVGNALLDGSGNVLFFDSFAAPSAINPAATPGIEYWVRNLNFSIGIGSSGRNSVSLYASNLLLNYLCRGTGTPPPATYAALAVDVPVPANNDGKELSGDAGYNRQAVSLVPGLSGAPTGAWSNSSPFSFGPFAADETVVGVDTYDSIVGGNLLFGGLIAYTATYSAGQSFDWNAAHLWIRLS